MLVIREAYEAGKSRRVPASAQERAEEWIGLQGESRTPGELRSSPTTQAQENT